MLVSIGLPFFNSERTLSYAVRSILAQTYSNWELILVDDGSTDSSLLIALSFEDERIKVFTDGINRGLPERLNQITSLANGIYIARMDSDDIMHPDRIRRQVDFLNKHHEIDVVGTSTYVINDKNELTGIRSTSPLSQNPTKVLIEGLFIHPSILGRKQWFIDNPYDQEYIRAEDHELWCRTTTKSKFAKITEPLLFYRETKAINLNGYLQSCKTDRKIFRKYGPNYLSLLHMNLLIIKSIMKGLLYKAFYVVGKTNILIKKRNIALSKTQRDEAQKTLNLLLDN